MTVTDIGVTRIAGRLVGAIVGVAIVVALVWRVPINGWGSIVWLASAIAVPVLRAPFLARTRDNEITDDRQDRTERILLALVGIGGGLVPLVGLLTGVFEFADYDLAPWSYGVGTVLVLAGLVLFRRSHTDLDANWSVTLQMRAEHTLVTSGVYRSVRHPMYTSLLLIYAAYPLLIHNWIGGWSGLVAFVVMCVVRIPHEESMMRVHFGDEYERYMARTGRLLPARRSTAAQP